MHFHKHTFSKAEREEGQEGFFVVVRYGLAVSRCVPLLGEAGGQWGWLRRCVRESELLVRWSPLVVWGLERFCWFGV
ncbi:hypothetical protein RHGRI_005085 [Rhododendron griersonianum]|uniref:Uncharacterized protein n=1 Tax=Rhododendron griersonianum TaxID=479676 RepID=A0AAV6LCU3_9ERIC|nr:hypothetical protein RHGRI_005085 [Rhododendron griersonianum]